MKVSLERLGLRARDIDPAGAIMQTGRLTMGDNVAEFERKMAQYLGICYFVMVNAGSAANLVILGAMLRPSKGKLFFSAGNGVLVRVAVWPASFWQISRLGLTPIIKVRTFCICKLLDSLNLRCKIPFDLGLEI